MDDRSTCTHALSHIHMQIGTGSGSLSHHFLRTIAPSGHLFTFEYHQQRAEAATAEFTTHGLTEYVTVAHRDVCADGFGLVDQVDAVFLDLPNPWKAIPFAKQALRKDRMTRICSFSPCIEQVQQTCTTLLREGFQDLYMVEVIVRPFDVKRVPYDAKCIVSNAPLLTPSVVITKADDEIKGHTSFLTFAIYLATNA